MRFENNELWAKYQKHIGKHSDYCYDHKLIDNADFTPFRIYFKTIRRI